MNNLHDLLLSKPLDESFMAVLLFSSFALHLLFVLLMLGTAMIAVFFFVHSLFTGYRFELRWDKRVLRIHLALKSLAVVLGIGPLLIIQVLWSIPMLTAATILAPYWLGLTGLMIFAFLSLDTLAHKIEVHPLRHTIFGILGLASLMAVPAVFTAVLTLMENPDKWASVSAAGLGAEPGLVFHWLMRYLHILGAAALFGGAFHYFFSTTGAEERHYHLSNWMVVATLFQVVVGVLLLVSVMEKLTPAVTSAVTVGMVAAMLLVGLAFYGNQHAKPARIRWGLVLLPVILVSMLLARQFLQHQVMAPVQATLAARASQLGHRLSPFKEVASLQYDTHLATVYKNGETIYANSCAFCHGIEGDGDGLESAELIIPPEKLNALRANRQYANQIILKGIPWSGMPYFSIFDKTKLESLLDYLHKKFQLTAEPRPEGRPGDMAAAREMFSRTCSKCHGDHGQISAFGRNLQPAPPDFMRYGLTSAYAYSIITNGYNGTAMQPFKNLPEATRWGLVSFINAFRTTQ